MDTGSAFVATMLSSTALAVGSWLGWHRWAARRRPLRLPIGPSMTPRAALITVVATFAACAVPPGLAVAAHDVAGMAALFAFAALIPWGVIAVLALSAWAVRAERIGELVLDGDRLRVELRGEARELRGAATRALIASPAGAFALELAVDGVVLLMPLSGDAGEAWAATLQAELPVRDVAHPAALPVVASVVQARALSERLRR